MPDMKVSDPGNLAALSGNSASRSQAVDRANRSTDRTAASTAVTSDIWLLPMTSYKLTTAPWGERPGTLPTTSLELAAPEGTPFYAAHGGTVTMARWHGAYGYTVIVNVGNGLELVYGHASKLLVKEGQTVEAGDLLALTGNTGYSFTPHVHFELRSNGKPVDASKFLYEHGVNIQAKQDSLTS
jgi:murein DD-endopeptidase MepM/ murein hydrolase activator NlpD